MRGRGIGPKAKVSTNEINLYDIPITHRIPIEPKIIIQNIGVIACDYTIESPGTPCSKQFIIDPISGKIPPKSEKDNGEQIINASFVAERLGEFSEKFLVKIGKSKDVIPIIFKGHVIAPYCRFSVERLDFEKVSKGFDKELPLVLYNESEVEIDYNLRIATDSQDSGKSMDTVFDISPKSGKVEPKKSRDIKITFRPDKERQYDIVVLLDMKNIGYDMLTLPVSGICEVPEVVIEPMDVLDFGEVYIRQKVHKKITLRNTSSTLSTQYTIKKQDDQSKNWGLITVDNESGEIAPEQTVEVDVTLQALKLQQIRLKLEIDCKTKETKERDRDKEDAYINPINITAVSTGPVVRVANEAANKIYADTKDKEVAFQKAKECLREQKEYVVDFGVVKTLSEKTIPIYLWNLSPIDADYTAFMKVAGSIFYIKNPKERIAPKEFKKIEISCKPDEQMKFLETLYFKVEESEGFEITLKATGDGTTIVPEGDTLTEIDFGTVFTGIDILKDVKFYNKGRSDQYIHFQSKKPKKKPTDEKNQNKKKKGEEEEVEVFRFKEAAKGSLPSHKCGSMTFIAHSDKPGEQIASYGVHCYKTSDNNGPETWDVKIKANFIEPHLEFTPKQLTYKYDHDKDSNKDTISEKLIIKNVAGLKADFNIIAEPPFSISKDKFTIMPNESETIQVDFDPSANKKKKKIELFEGKLIFKHNNHSKVEDLKMLVQINFPNIKNLPSELNFGCLLNDTFTKKTLKLERDTASDLEVAYEWQLIELENSYESIKKGKQVTKKIPLNEVFSIVPMNGKLKKGELEAEEVTITFTPGPNQRYTAIAKCKVEGGPEYELKLSGEASEIKYELKVNYGENEFMVYDSNKKEFPIQFGEINFNETSSIYLSIVNKGEVPFDYRINYKSDKLRYLSLSNAIDTVNKGDTKKVKIEVIPGSPDKMDDEIVAEIAHFEPHHIKIKAIGYFRGLSLFPLERKEENFKELLQSCKENFDKRRRMLEDYFYKNKGKKNVIALPDQNEIIQRGSTGDKKILSEDALFELEADRTRLCENILDRMSKGEITANIQPQQSSVFSIVKKEKPLNVNSAEYRLQQLKGYMKDLVIAEYKVCFGNVVHGKGETISFNITNLNKGHITFFIDKKEMQTKGYEIKLSVGGNDKIMLDEGKTVEVKVTHKTFNTKPDTEVNNIMNIQLETGEVYRIHLNTYVSLPNLKLTILDLRPELPPQSPYEIDMGKVCIGRKKIKKFRIQNTSRVDCSWFVNILEQPNRKGDREQKKEEIKAFTISPERGKLTPGEKLTLTTTFVPIKKSTYYCRFVFNIDSNAKKIDVPVSGIGEELLLEVKPVVPEGAPPAKKVEIGPILPYYKYGYKYIEFTNPNECPIEVYSSDFDTKYLEEEKMLKNFKPFINDPEEKMDVKIRQAGEPIWNKFSSFSNQLEEKIKLFREYSNELCTQENESFDNLFNQNMVERLTSIIPYENEVEVKIPPAIKKSDRLNVVLIGPPQSGKTSVLKEQIKKQYRGLISIGGLIEWNKENGHEDMEEKIRLYKEEKKKEYDEKKVAYDKLVKQAKSNKKIEVPDPPSEGMYLYISKEIFNELMTNRLSADDCRIGAVFDDLQSELLENPETALEFIEDYFKDENLLLVYFDFPKEDDLDVCHYINWSDYIQELQKVKRKPTVKVEKKPAVKKSKPKKQEENQNDEDKEEKEEKKEVIPIKPETIEKFEELFTKFISENQPINSIVTSSPKEMTEEEKNEYMELVNRMKTKMEELKERRLNPPVEEPIEEQPEEEKKEDKKEEKKEDKKEDKKKKEEPKKEENKEEIKEGEEAKEGEEIKEGEEPQPQPQPEEPQEELKPVERNIASITFEYCIPQLLLSYLSVVPDPILPNPEDLEIPKDEEVQIITRPANRKKSNIKPNFTLKGIAEPYKNLSIDELIDKLKAEEKRKEDYIKEKEAAAANPKAKKVDKNAPPEEPFKPEEILIDKTRWIIPPHEKERAVVNFFSEDVLNKGRNEVFTFETMTYPPVQYKIDIEGKSDYPSMTSVGTKKAGTKGILTRKEEDFGYILITHDDNRELSKYKATNCRTLKFSNNSLYTIHVDFSFLSEMNFEGLGFDLPFQYGKSTDPNFGVEEKNPKDKAKKGKADPSSVEPSTPFVLEVIKKPKKIKKEEVKEEEKKEEEKKEENKKEDTSKKEEKKEENKDEPKKEEENKEEAKEEQKEEEPKPIIISTLNGDKVSLDIEKGETQELNIYAFPGKPTEYKDELLCLIENNPVPTRIALICKGAEPNVILEENLLDFDKLVINQLRNKPLVLKNQGEVNCKWNLSGLENLPEVFKIEPKSGVIEKGKEQHIQVSFCSEKQEKYDFTFNLEIEDNLGYGVKMETKPVQLKAEAFEVSVKLLDLTGQDDTIDFGNVKVREMAWKQFKIKNVGIYKVKYKFEIMKKHFQELFQFDPNEGEIESGAEKTITAIFNSVPQDVKLNQERSASEIKLSIFEGEKGTKVKPLNIKVKVASHFSKYLINPMKSINFGSMQYNESATRYIEIKNSGQFAFNYEIFEYLQDIKEMQKIKDEKDKKEMEEQKLKQQEIQEAREIANSGKAAKKAPAKAPPKNDPKKGKGAQEEELRIGKYVIKNFKGVVEKDSVAKIEVTFTAEGQQFCSANLAIDIQGREPEDNKLGIPFDLVAESCIPGIETQDFDSIFEEQTVLASISPDSSKRSFAASGVYGIEEKVFWFGTVILSKNPDGVAERFKLINNNKIPCNVRVSIKQRSNNPKVEPPPVFKISCRDSNEIGTTTPLKIYPGESEYVTVTFTPLSVMPYSAIFEATVEGGSQETGSLKFELTGEGTLPTLLLQSPNDLDQDGTPLLKFKRTRLEKAVEGELVLKNEGVVPATVKFDPLASDVFSFESSTTATIQPKNYQSFRIKFRPKEEKTEKATLSYQTLFNNYEKTRLNISGEGFFEPVSLEGLANDTDLIFGDVCMEDSREMKFTLINHSDTNYRFEFINNLETYLEFFPRVGFLLQKEQKEIRAVFTAKDLPKEPAPSNAKKDPKAPVEDENVLKFINKDLFLELTEIKFPEGEAMRDWDDTQTELKKIPKSEKEAIEKKREEEKIQRKDAHESLINSITGGKGGGKSSAPKKDPKKDNKNDKNINKAPADQSGEEICEFMDIIPEPTVEINDKAEKKHLPIKFTAIGDWARYECNIKEIRFKPTVMFATRKFDFHLTNKSAI
ncbi:MAG: hypothetical protein MJ252_00825, partial [archaeon]|nr:hypothetical protein [archaeon]